MCTVFPVTVHFPVAAKPTLKPDDAVALTRKSASPNVLGNNVPKEIVWSVLGTMPVS